MSVAGATRTALSRRRSCAVGVVGCGAASGEWFVPAKYLTRRNAISRPLGVPNTLAQTDYCIHANANAGPAYPTHQQHALRTLRHAESDAEQESVVSLQQGHPSFVSTARPSSIVCPLPPNSAALLTVLGARVLCHLPGIVVVVCCWTGGSGLFSTRSHAHRSPPPHRRSCRAQVEKYCTALLLPGKRRSLRLALVASPTSCFPQQSTSPTTNKKCASGLLAVRPLCTFCIILLLFASAAAAARRCCCVVAALTSCTHLSTAPSKTYLPIHAACCCCRILGPPPAASQSHCARCLSYPSVSQSPHITPPLPAAFRRHRPSRH
ncbi:hypothetical protein M409DRAFT_56513 [Zasmidium cellare ATCC 36951]|uniref:Uncharacterized protein n=1 Tax=Zasmidium cellare ATCC 36951 TaxID=1080233 RepID=A0A6A6CD97_ZASCE|nr:uncharacterized protein M409DRAFT_56513 [Zasmidium cellare ATCC 36951]KAF2164703.1 hypothetical protein M409DRAFT_56513 [Zasmidium cellare ATCC 36951]